MILFEGKLFPDEKMDEIIEKLWDSCVQTVTMREDIAVRVIDACGRVSEKIKAGAYDQVLLPLLEKGTFTRAQMEEAIAFFDRDNLLLKYNTELGILKKDMEEKQAINIEKRLEPLGILFHIAAGNAEGLPFFSVLEGMLAGNVNILKLPSMDDGISVLLLHEIIKEEPMLAPYVCVLDVASTNVKILKTLADMADAIVVWGGDEAVMAARTMASPSTQIISWGHKLSFAYITPEVFEKREEDICKKELYALARHICETKQLLCSSCQGIFVDTEDESVVALAGEAFMHILEEVSVDYPLETIGIRGKLSISLYNEQLESAHTGRNILRGKGVGVITAMDSDLELSYMFKNCWVKPLPRKNIVKALKGKKGYLQTVGLICAESERAEFVNILTKTGVTHVARGGSMSQMLPGGTHDGEYPLRRYSRIVEVEK